ncbi:MAG: adenosylmethionine decarboxylase [Oligoflexia bacterium]|nr:adenosylmethionine decarboxylase [Oligoflexia bacterium]MBF0366084.1 adenosylmethionine decarboxylase [Oligoflexia bacterium]
MANYEFESKRSENSDTSKIKLSGFNNLTKILSFNLYDFCLTIGEEQRQEYVNYIHERYNADRLTKISEEICKIIEANVLGVSKQDYDPSGASSLLLMSDIKGGGSQVSMHLDKSHITTHTYPDTADKLGVCSFRVDIDIATCGEILPLNAINHLFKAFECDVVVMDYVVRGYTRLANGQKIYNDHAVHSIKDFIDPKILADYKICADINLPNDNIWQTKLLIRDDFGAERYLLDPKDKDRPEVAERMGHLYKEMKEIFHLVD